MTPVTIAGDTDVSTAGTAVFAYDWNSSDQTVNGVSFTAPGSGVTQAGIAVITMVFHRHRIASYRPEHGLSECPHGRRLQQRRARHGEAQ